MKMHDYAIFGHDRTTIGRWLGVISIMSAVGISQLLVTCYQLTGIEAFTQATLTTGVIYAALDWFFNKTAWKINFFKIPDLNGSWHVEGQTLDDNGGTKYHWSSELDIEQEWKTISIGSKTDKSQSHSYTATLLKKPGAHGGWILSYSYTNNTNLEQSHELNSHKGYCEIEFAPDLKTGKATYFNSNGRRTYGIMDLSRSTHD